MKTKLSNSLHKALALALVVLLGAWTVPAGVLVRGTEGITMTGADGVYYEDLSGITMTGADGLLGLKVNGVTLPVTSDGITMTGADGATYTGVPAVTATRADGITMTGADGITMTGADGLQRLGLDGITMTGADGITMTGADGITMTGADSVTVVTSDGRVLSVSPNGITMTGADGITMTGADGITMTGADGLTTMTTADDSLAAGLQGLDPELALLLNKMTDDSAINAVVTFHHYPTDADLTAMRTLGITGGTRFRKLPMVVFSAFPSQIVKLSQLPSVRSIWGARTLQWNAEQTSALTGTGRVYADADLKSKNKGLAVTGRNVTVAVLDTGLDGTHLDVSNRVLRNVKLADLQGLSSLGFQYPANIEGLKNTDLLGGHGTFVSGIIAGSGARSNGRFQGVAPGAKLVGLSAGDANLLFVLAGFDYLLTQGPTLKVRVVNCSFSANTVYDPNDPVNVATKLLTSAGVNVVFSAGNTGPGADSLNPYALAPWVISAGATDARGRLAQFSGRGAFGSATRRRPTLVAPGVDMISLRATGLLNQTGLNGLSSGADTRLLSPTYLPFYTAGSGTSFSAPVVAGTIALMLEANPNLKPAEVRDILQRTATPIPSNYSHEVGAGMLNAHAAVLEAAFPARRMGMWRATLNRGQVRFIKNAPRQFTGTVLPGLVSTTSLVIPSNTVSASVRIAWGPLLTINDLGLKVYDPAGVMRSHVNLLNLPGLTGRAEATEISSPAAGTWKVGVFNTLGLLGLPQTFTGRLDVERVEYAPLVDITGLAAATQTDVRQNLRSFVMMPVGSRFFPSWPVTRGELAATLLRGARVPQYMPAVPTYADVRSIELMNFVESVQSAPGGPLIYDAPAGGPFYPDRSVKRLAAAVALVRAAGLRAEAENYTGPMPNFADLQSIPVEYRGYAAVAHLRGLLKASGNYFSPNGTLRRVQLAQGMAALIKLNS